MNNNTDLLNDIYHLKILNTPVGMPYNVYYDLYTTRAIVYLCVLVIRTMCIKDEFSQQEKVSFVLYY